MGAASNIDQQYFTVGAQQSVIVVLRKPIF